MDATANIKNRLPTRHLTEAPSWAGSRAPAARRPSPMAYGFGSKSGLPDRAENFKKTSNAADLKPAGRDVAKDMREIGGISLLMKTLLDNGHLRGDCITASGRTIAEDLKSVKGNPRPDVVRRAPVGASAEVAGMSTLKFTRPIRCFDREAEEGVGRPIRPLQDGDIVEIDAPAGILNVKLTGAEFAERRTKWQVRETNHRSGALWKFAQEVGPALGGAVIHSGAHEKCYADI